MSRDEQGVWIADEESESTSSSIDDVSDIEDISEEIKENPKRKNKKEQEVDTSVTQFRPKKSKWVKWLVIALIILGVGGFITFKVVQAKKKLEEMMGNNNTTTAEIERMDIVKAISTTGTVQSKDVRTITSPLAGVKIDKVNYKIGDMVEQGSIVVTFSVEDINKKIGQLEEDILEAKQVKSLDSGDRTNTYVNNYDLQSYSVATAYEGLERETQDLNKAKEKLSEACEEKSKYIKEYEEAKNNIDDARRESITKQYMFNEWLSKHPDDGSLEYKLEKDELQRYVNEASSLVTTYETRISSYDKGIDTYITAVKNAESSLLTAQRNYDDAYLKYNKSGYDASFSDAKSDYNLNRGNVKANDDVKSLERQKEEREDSLENYIVTAPISGVVTSVNAQEGNGYQATTGALMTIQAVDVFEVTTQVDEYDINNVKVGQEVKIMTDATGEDELEGRVTFIAPTATAATGNSTSNTFEVKIDVVKKDERLKLGMSARLNIVVDTHNNVLAVPYDAIEQKEGGETVIYAVDKPAGGAKKEEDKNILGITVVGMDGQKKEPEDGNDNKDKEDGKPGFDPKAANAKEIPVQVGLESDYYTEVISNEIHEGMTVLVNSTAGELGPDMSLMGM